MFLHYYWRGTGIGLFQSLSEVTGYGLDDQISIPDIGRDFSLCYHIQTTSGTLILYQRLLIYIVAEGGGLLYVSYTPSEEP
jgi:hypothetical protein